MQKFKLLLLLSNISIYYCMVIIALWFCMDRRHLLNIVLQYYDGASGGQRTQQGLPHQVEQVCILNNQSFHPAIQ
jgi:hypothetical protein